MSDVVRNWDANFAGEIELTDAELESVYGSWGDDWGGDGNQGGHDSKSVTVTGTFALTAAGNFSISDIHS